MTTTAERARYTIADPAGVEDDATVEFDLTAGDNEDAHRNVTSILINGKVDLGIEQARKVAAQMIALCDSATPADPAGLGALTVMLTAINDGAGTSHTVKSLAADCGVDLERATAEDVSTMAQRVGRMLAESRATLEPGDPSRQIVLKGAPSVEGQEFTPLFIAALMSETGKDFSDLFDIVTL